MHSSLWEKMSTRQFSYPSLSNAIEVDVAIIGGGITGITAALELMKAGKKVAVLEAYKIGGVTTSHSTGNLYVPTEALFQKIVKNFGIKASKKVAETRAEAIDIIEKNVKEFKINCHFTRRPWYMFASEDKAKLVEDEYETFQKLGVAAEPVKDLPFDLKFSKAFSIANQARFNPLQYVISLAEALHSKGCLLFEHTRLMEIKEENKAYTLVTEQGRVQAKVIVMATHSPLGIHTTQFYTAAYRSYVVAATKPDGSIPDGNLWDQSAPFAISTHASSDNKLDILTIAGSHHKTGQGEETICHFKAIENYLKRHFPEYTMHSLWSAQHFQTADRLPYIGPTHKKNYYIATGYFADGLVYGTLAGKMLAQQIADPSHALSSPYSANRHKPLASLKFLVKENSNVFYQYAKDLPQKETHHFRSIKPGEGKVIEINQEKIAVFRDKQNNLHKVSAVCTHMKCIVNWNDAEQTWDCPCHGSRFKTSGEVLEGPAISKLKTID